MPKNGLFFDILVDFWGPCSGGSKMAFFGLLKYTFGVSGFRGSAASRGVCKCTCCRVRNCYQIKIEKVCRGFLPVQILEDFGGDSPGRFFWTLFPPIMRRNNPTARSTKSKRRIREKAPNVMQINTPTISLRKCNPRGPHESLSPGCRRRGVEF